MKRTKKNGGFFSEAVKERKKNALGGCLIEQTKHGIAAQAFWG